MLCISVSCLWINTYKCNVLPRHGNGILFDDAVSFTVTALNPDLVNFMMTGRLHKPNSYDPAIRLLTLICCCCEVMMTSLTGVKQSLETIDIVFCIESHVGA